MACKLCTRYLRWFARINFSRFLSLIYQDSAQIGLNQDRTKDDNGSTKEDRHMIIDTEQSEEKFTDEEMLGRISCFSKT
jgi:hypothetical protein